MSTLNGTDLFSSKSTPAPLLHRNKTFHSTPTPSYYLNVLLVHESPKSNNSPLLKYFSCSTQIKSPPIPFLQMESLTVPIFASFRKKTSAKTLVEITINSNNNTGAANDDIMIGQLTYSAILFSFLSRAREASIKALSSK